MNGFLNKVIFFQASYIKLIAYNNFCLFFKKTFNEQW